MGGADAEQLAAEYSSLLDDVVSGFKKYGETSQGQKTFNPENKDEYSIHTGGVQMGHTGKGEGYKELYLINGKGITLTHHTHEGDVDDILLSRSDRGSLEMFLISRKKEGENVIISTWQSSSGPFSSFVERNDINPKAENKKKIEASVDLIDKVDSITDPKWIRDQIVSATSKIGLNMVAPPVAPPQI